MSTCKPERVDRVLEINELLRVYGALLTKRQFDVLSRRYGQDLSLGEIAQTDNITRQGVHSFEKKALRQLEKYEKHLGMIAKQDTIKSLLGKMITDENAREALTEMLI